jgi:C4-dicarboxylate transporter DctM subunit
MESHQLTVILFLLGGFFFLLAIKLEIAWCVGIIATFGLVFIIHQPIRQLAWTSWSSLNSFSLVALPLFILMGSILANSGVSEYLFAAVEKWIGPLPGGLASSVIAGNAIFGAMCGSSLAAVATFGKLAIPEMDKRAYDPKLSLGSVCAGGILSPLIPPSLLLIVYGSWQQLSIGALFAAAIIPGFLLAVLWVILIMIRVKMNPSLVPPPIKATWAERMIALKGISPFAAIIIGVLGVIFGGIMTPSEAGGMGAFLSLLVAIMYRRLSMGVLKKSLYEAVRVTSMALFIMAMSSVLSHVFNSSGITLGVKDYVIGLGLGKTGTLILFYIMYLILGCFIDAWSMLFITFPFVMPVVAALNIDPVWWGIAYLLCGEQCLVTPPFGMNLFVLQSVAPHHSFANIVRGSLPFLIPMYILLFLMMVFPQIALWLPHAFYK